MKTLLQKSKWLLCAITGLTATTNLSAQVGQGHHEIYHQSTYGSQGYYAASFNKLTHADLNGDGVKDMIITGNYVLDIFLFNSAGGFRVQQIITFPYQPAGYGAAVAADLNSDGETDFAWYDWQLNDVIVSYGNSISPSGDPLFAAPGRLNVSGLENADGQGTYNGLYGMNAADIDNDGDTDLLAFGPNGTQRPHMILNNGGGNFTRYDLHDLPFYQSFSRVRDMNNDGLPDIIVSTGSTVDLYTNTGNAGNPSIPVFTHSVLLDGSMLPGFDSNSGWFDLEDFDQDGKIDILVSYKEYRYLVGSFFGKTLLFINRTSAAPAYNFVSSNLFELQQQNWSEERLGGFGSRYLDIDNNGTLDIIGNRGGQQGNDYDKISLVKLAIDGAGNATVTESTLLDYNPLVPGNYQGMNLVYDDIDGDNKRDYIYAAVNSSIITRNTVFPAIKSGSLLVDLSNQIFIGGDRNEDIELTLTISDLAGAFNFNASSPAQVQGAGSPVLTITGKLGEVNMDAGSGSISFSQMGTYTLNYSVRNTNTQEVYTNTQQIILAPPTFYPRPGLEMSLNDINSWSDSPDGLGTTPAGFNAGFDFILFNANGVTEFGATDFSWIDANLIIPKNAVFNLNGYLPITGNIEMKGEIKGLGYLQMNGQQNSLFEGNVALGQLETSGDMHLKGKLKVQDYLYVGTGLITIDSGSVELSGGLNRSAQGNIDASAGEFRLQNSYTFVDGDMFVGNVQKMTLNHSDINFLNGNLQLDTLNIEQGKLLFENGELLANVILGGDANSYLAAQNATIKTHIADGQSFRFPIGGDYYNPVTITNNTGTDDDFSAVSTFDMGQQEYAMLNPASRVYHVWEISKANPNSGAGVDIKVEWNVAQEWQMGLAGLYHFENNDWVELTDGTISRAPQQMTYIGYKGTFSPFSIMSSFATLPVTWKSFEAKAVNKSVVLSWSTGSETNSREFEVQRSVDGISWKKVGTVDALNDINGSRYSYIDYQPISGANYYRLNQLDKDGRNSLSKTVVITFNGLANLNQRFKAYPNPVTNNLLRLDLTTESLVSVYNSAGLQVIHKRMPAGSHVVSLARFPKGVYTISINDQVQRIVVQ